MIDIPTVTSPAYHRGTVMNLNRPAVEALTSATVGQLNMKSPAGTGAASPTAHNAAPAQNAYTAHTATPAHNAYTTHNTQTSQTAYAVPKAHNAPAYNTTAAHTVHTVPKVQNTTTAPVKPSAPAAPAAPSVPAAVIPKLVHPLRKGQKTPIDPAGKGIAALQVRFGWNVRDQRCDLDASAFLIGENGKVRDDGWFVFYGQPQSPDGSVRFAVNPGNTDRETIHVDFRRLDPTIRKIVFVITINEAFERNLNFSMVEDTYVRLMDGQGRSELLSYRLEENFANVTSMTVGELYLHQGVWKFNPVGNGIHDDLAGQCGKYGVNIV